MQRRLVEWLTVGVEIFHQAPKDHGDEGDARLNFGAVLDLTEMHHLPLSGGAGLERPNVFQGYVAYQLTFGPNEGTSR